VGRNRERWKRAYKTVEVWLATGCDETEGSYSASLILKSLPMYNKLGIFGASLVKKLTTV